MINVPHTKQPVDRLFHNNDFWEIMFAQFLGQINNLFLTDRLLQFAQVHFFSHVAVLSKLSYVHVAVNMYSVFKLLLEQTGETTKHVITHCLEIPKNTKMYNGFGYISKTFRQFCSQWNIEYKTGIPYNPQGQGIVKHAHTSLKTQVQKLNKGEIYPQSH